MQSFRDVIERWPSKPALAAEIGENPGTVRVWHHRDQIPAIKLRKVADAAQAAGFSEITYAVLTDLLKARQQKEKAQ